MDSDQQFSMAMEANNDDFFQQYSYWQGVSQLSTIVMPSPLEKAASFPPTTQRKRRRLSSDKDLQEKKHKRILKNRESAARSRARKLAYVKELQNKVCRLEEENKILMTRLQELNWVQQEGTSQRQRANSVPL